MIDSGKLRRKLGLSAIIAIVVGDMLGSGIFFTPGELAIVAQATWQIYLIWGLCGFITLCGALTVAELTSVFPQAGATYHIIRAGYGPFWAFLKIWIEMLIGGPGSIAGVAIVFGQLASQFVPVSPIAAALIPIAFFTIINLLGVQWGGGIQMILTGLKVTALVALIAGSLFVSPQTPTISSPVPLHIPGLFQLLGLGIAAVLFTYDGWLDVTHVAGEVKDPQRVLPAGLAIGVGMIILIYLLTNYAFLRVVSVEEMKEAPTLIAATAATKILGYSGGMMLKVLIAISIFGAIGGLIMTFPRLFYAAATEYADQAWFFKMMASVSFRTAVPWASILFTAAASTIALLLFQSFSGLINFILVPLQVAYILAVATIFKIRNREGFHTPGYPVLPLLYILVLSVLLVSAVIYRTRETGMGILLTMTGIPVYFWIKKREQR